MASRAFALAWLGGWTRVRFRPEGDLLFFACAKKSKQKKAHPGPAPAKAGALRCSPKRALRNSP